MDCHTIFCPWFVRWYGLYFALEHLPFKVYFSMTIKFNRIWPTEVINKEFENSVAAKQVLDNKRCHSHMATYFISFVFLTVKAVDHIFRHQ